MVTVDTTTADVLLRGILLFVGLGVLGVVGLVAMVALGKWEGFVSLFQPGGK